MQGGAIYSNIRLTIINSTFESNIAADGAEVYTSTPRGLSTFIGCIFQGRVPCLYNSAIYCASGQMVIRESLFHNLNPVILSLVTRHSSLVTRIGFFFFIY